MDFCFFTSVIYKDIHAMLFTLLGYYTFISKTSLKCSKTNTLCIKCFKEPFLTSSWFSPHKLLFSSLLQSALSYVHQALQEALEPYGLFLIGRITFTVWESNSWNKKRRQLCLKEDTFQRLVQFKQKALPLQKAHAIFRMNMHPAAKSKLEYFFSLLV